MRLLPLKPSNLPTALERKPKQENDKMRSDTVVAYTFRADIYCPTCIVVVMIADGADPEMGESGSELALDVWAANENLDRYDERTFDSGDFPKVVFADQVNDNLDEMGPEHCGNCGKVILEP